MPSMSLELQKDFMSVDSLSPEQIELRQKELLGAVPDVNPIGNKALREQLGSNWSEDLYWAVRNRLVERGLLEIGRGRGGSVKKVPPPASIQVAQDPDLPDVPIAQSMPQQEVGPDYSRELELYQPISAVIRNQWAKAQGFDSYLVEVTAKQGSRQTGGKWSRPDVTVVGYKTFPYLPGRFLEVASFEVKTTDTIDVSAVYEALAHRRAATRAHVVFHIPTARRTETDNVLEAVSEEAKRLGIGVIVADDPTDFDTWEILFEANRFEPDPGKLNEFIAQQTTSELKEQIVRWFK